MKESIDADEKDDRKPNHMEQNFVKEFNRITGEVQKAIVGQESVIKNCLTAMVAGGNVLLEGLPGLGKTQLVKAIGKALDMAFQRIQFTPDLMPADITGTMVYNKNRDGGGQFEFQKGPLFSHIILADEINRATPKTQSALLEAMQEGTITVGTKTYPLPAPFFVIATQNPLEMEGTYPLPEAQMDRFLFQLNVARPSEEELLRIIALTTGAPAPEPQKVTDSAVFLQMRRAARAVPISETVAAYAARLVLRTHPGENAPAAVRQYVRYGASPRAAQALVATGKIYALLDGRFNVAYEDIRSLAPDVLRHRVFLNYDALSDGITPEEIVAALLKEPID